MIKDFTRWHNLKRQLESRESRAYFHERDIWLASLGANLGHEEDGKGEDFLRPIVIIKKFNNDMFWAIPLTSTIAPYEHYYPVEFKGRKSSVTLLQLRALDRKRLFYRMGSISQQDHLAIKEKMVSLLELITQNPSVGGVLETTCQPPEAEASVDDSSLSG